jgi:hypothetical protein
MNRTLSAHSDEPWQNCGQDRGTIHLGENGHVHSGAAFHDHHPFGNGFCDHVFSGRSARQLQRFAIALRCQFHLFGNKQPPLFDNPVDSARVFTNFSALGKNPAEILFLHPRVICLFMTSLYNTA